MSKPSVKFLNRLSYTNPIGFQYFVDKLKHCKSKTLQKIFTINPELIEYFIWNTILGQRNTILGKR